MALEGDTGAVLLLRNLVTPHLGLRPSPRSYLSSVSKSHDASREDKAAIVPCTFTREKLPVQVATRNTPQGVLLTTASPVVSCWGSQGGPLGSCREVSNGGWEREQWASSRYR